MRMSNSLAPDIKGLSMFCRTRSGFKLQSLLTDDTGIDSGKNL